MNTWDARQCLNKVDIVKRADTGADPDIFDSFFGFGGFGDPFLADITEAGWLPRAFFEAVGGPGGGRGILAFSVTFIFTDDDGNPTDINGDNRLDTALNEVYYNNTFGDPANDRAGNPWGINVDSAGHRRRDRRAARERTLAGHRALRTASVGGDEPGVRGHQPRRRPGRPRGLMRGLGVMA